MSFSIITPSYQSSSWLKLCIESVADQHVHLEHIIQDAGSTDGTLNWLREETRATTFVEKDAGMYDAVNRGLKKSRGDICAYLNCDEQYLPGTLKFVQQFFKKNPSVEIAFGDVVIVNSEGQFLCHRKSLLPLKAHSMVSGNLSILTCATFFRRSVFEKRGLFFNSQLRDLGDADWIIRCIQNRVPMGLLKCFTSVFTDTGANMNWKPNAVREKKELFSAAPIFLRAAKPLIVAHHRLRKLFSGAYRQKPFSYEIYTLKSPGERVSFEVSRPVARWKQGVK